MKSSPALDNLLLLLAALSFIALCFTIVGIVPVLIMIVGLVLAFKTKDVQNVTMSSRLVQIVTVVLACVCGYMVAKGNAANTEQRTFILFVVGSVPLIVEFFWLGPLTRQLPRWIAR